ncbi:hypothetical protein, partial [Pseudomonas viridiflava]|uniref:hypothetical protein n=1 Tax=Pseudomonas viridiflava TaxID=33069 RepID=UPI0013DFC917
SMQHGRKIGSYVTLYDDACPLRPLLKGRDADRRAAMLNILRPYVTGASQGVFWVGADLGERNDPTEILLSEEAGTELRDLVRIRAIGFPYHLQEE